MRKVSKFYLVILLVFLTAASSPAEEMQKEGKVSISWQEFQRLLELDKDEFVLSWEEFQKILQQTGFKYVPPFQLKDEKVVLTRIQFNRLLDQMKPPKDVLINPPADYLLDSASYSGVLSAGSVHFHAVLEVEIFEKERNQYVKIPLFPLNVALENVRTGGKSVYVVIQGNQYVLTTDKAGRHTIEVDFTLKTSTEQGPWSITFPIPQTTVTRFALDIPFKEIDVELANAQSIEVIEKGGHTQLTALLSPARNINLRWRKKLKDIEKGPAKVYADTVSLLSFEDDALRVNSQITLSILQNTISSLVIQRPEGYSILNVQGSGIADWREITEKGGSFLEVMFDYPKKGNFTLTITAEKLLASSSLAVGYAGFAVQDAIREKGFIGIELRSTSEVALSSLDGLDQLDVSELPPSLINRSQKPLLFGFKYLYPGFSLVLDITKHEELPVIGTVVDSASGVSLFTEDGKIVHRIVFLVRNTSKQFMEMDLPAGSTVWSVFVAGAPAKPRLSGKKILIPLNRSVHGAAGLEAFNVELIYFQKASRFGRLGRGESMFPTPDVLISQMLWSIYLPEGYGVFSFGGTVEKEKIARGIRPLLGRKVKMADEPEAGAEHPSVVGEDKDLVKREALDRMKKQFSANLALTEEQLTSQMENEMRFSQRVADLQSGKAPVAAGILPIRVQIPTSGQLFRFAKTIVSEEPLTLNYSYIANGWFRVFLIVGSLGMVFFIYLMRRWFLVLKEKMRNRMNSGFLTLILIASAAVLWPFSVRLSLILAAAALAVFLVVRLNSYWRDRD